MVVEGVVYFLLTLLVQRHFFLSQWYVHATPWGQWAAQATRDWTLHPHSYLFPQEPHSTMFFLHSQSLAFLQ